MEYYEKNPEATQQLAGPLFEEKVIDYIVELANVTDFETNLDVLYDTDDLGNRNEDKKPSKKVVKKASKSKAKKVVKKATKATENKEAKKVVKKATKATENKEAKKVVKKATKATQKKAQTKKSQ